MRAVFLLAVVGCRSMPSDPLPRFDGGEVEGVVSDHGKTWLMIAAKQRTTWFGSVLCALDTGAASCAVVPGSAKGARLLEPDAGATPVVAIPDGDSGTLYLEPFTWKPVRRLGGVAFDQPGVVLRDGTMWIREHQAAGANVIVVPAAGVPRRWFSTGVRDVFVTRGTVIWQDHDIVSGATIDGDRLLTAIEYRGVRPWSQICRTGEMIGLMEAGSGDLVLAGTAHRIHATGNSNLQCRADWIVARAASGPAVWCSIGRGCDRAGDGPFTLTLPSGTPISDGTVEVSLGELRVSDRKGIPLHVAVSWIGIPPVW